MFQAARDHIGAMLNACLVVHVSSFLREVCKHFQSAECSLIESWKQFGRESILIMIVMSIRCKVA